ncbi:Ku protein [Rhizobium sp. Root73]|uniref:non-homologous end joining protein Ku n=1 Tax=unclassified Rhizobium TaxID=2613769 RepID=UPI000727F07E|nr:MULTISPECIES: Ku protein [unclassified Rhizobium]KQY17446.1 Ku protein [Rhizobium sp. Root1334]KRC13327.1 Ku protein [Rhizobium sp. Root73]
MAAVKPYWKGYLKLSLVTCPVALSPATSDTEKVRFHTMNRATGNRVASRYVDSLTGKEVDPDDQVKGYERGEGDYIILEEEELDAVALESVRTIEIELFTPRDSVEWIWLEKPHYLVPNDKVGEDAFAVIRDAMRAENVVGISRLVFGQRERAVMLEPRDEGIVLWTLRYGDEVRPEEEYFSGIRAKPEGGLAPLMKQLIKRQTKKWAPITDPIQDQYLELIAAKKKAIKKPTKSTAKGSPVGGKDNVIDIMVALKKSLEESKQRSR